MEQENCIEICKLSKDFFNNKLTIQQKDEVFVHLLKCEKCLRSFKFYIKSYRDEKFELILEAIKFCNDHVEQTGLETRRVLKELNTAGLYEFGTKYQSIAKEFKLSKLKDVVAVSSLFIGDDTIESIKDSNLLLEFAKYLCYNICKEIDYLERCYSKGQGILVLSNKKERKKNAKSKRL